MHYMFLNIIQLHSVVFKCISVLVMTKHSAEAGSSLGTADCLVV